MQEKPMSEIRVYPGTIIDGGGSKVVFTLTPIIGETREDYEHRCHEVFKLAVSLVAPSSPTFEVGDTSKYRKVGEHAYEIISSGYKPEEKPVSERETHFLGFARALLNDIFDDREGSLILGRDLYPQDNERVAQHIARRAYDLMYHACWMINNAQFKSGGVRLHPNAMMRAIEDLTELPE